jgi:hypothetical protein
MTCVVLLSGRSMNDALAAAGQAHRTLFESLGHDFVVVDFAQSGAQELLNQTVGEQSIEFVYGAAGGGADFRGTAADGRELNLWEGLRVPFLSLKGDSPAYFFDRHVMPTPWHACLYYFPEHLDLRRRLPLTPALYGLVPPVPFDMVEKQEIDFRKKEKGKLLFLKNGNDPEKLVRIWREAMPAATFIMLTDLAGELVNGINTESSDDIDALVTAYFMEKGWDISEFVNLRLFFVAQLDDYLRRMKSTMVADVLADFPVEIHGFNWEHFDFSHRRATFVPGGDYAQSKQQIVESLGIVDMSPNTQRAPHDRAMRAFGLCTLCLTNEQRFFKEQFARSELFSYRFEKDHLAAKIADVLAHPKQYVELGLEVAEQFRQSRRPHDFAQFMLDTASHIRLARGPRPAGLQDFFVWPPTPPSS